MPGDLLDTPALQGLAEEGNVLRRGAAAAAEHLHPQVGELGQAVGELLGRNVIAGAVRVGQAGVGF